MYDYIIDYLKRCTVKNKKTVTIDELAKLPLGNNEYEDLSKVIRQLLSEDILKAINPKNNDGRKDPLPLKLGINKEELMKGYILKLEQYSLNLNSEIDIQAYFGLGEDKFEKDKPYIDKVDSYIKANGLPQDTVTPQERSYQIFGDEKWIEKNSGKALLERIKIYNKLKIDNGSDPLMLAVNPLEYNKEQHKHLIVENKATFLGLLEVLPDTEFCSLIFGSGWKIVGNINMLESQTGLRENNIVYYFGDIDNEGVAIYNSLTERASVKLATEFYKELLKTDFKEGKKNQKKKIAALKNFVKNFSEEEQKLILDKLDTGYYWPQEGLSKTELQHIWRKVSWT
ncbi:Wadjet anti-phage system protein JetD domain-containing protein [Clostridium manihotivorum]|uniref:Cytosolic protein n=1 Tax=Clostridium manihotivorum TaxID=2320868 RepID=A0A410DX15_9CLOT|nr:Wadjet anti-phage system protein JetD domain-containing protein [Clostridium manihotivorum]QAA33472.1 cytosolic protein [Clostridium manihotivorum]